MTTRFGPNLPCHNHTRTGSTELYEAGFSTLGAHPMGGVAISRTIAQARQRLADMLIFCDPHGTRDAGIIAFHRAETVELPEHGRGHLHPGQRRHPGRTVIAHPCAVTAHPSPLAAPLPVARRMGTGERMCLTLANATAIIDHHRSPRAAGRGYTRAFHLASLLSPGDLWRPDPNGRPHTVTEVHRTRDPRNLPDRITLIDQYAQAVSYMSDELVPTAIPDPSTVFQRCICKKTR